MVTTIGAYTWSPETQIFHNSQPTRDDVRENFGEIFNLPFETLGSITFMEAINHYQGKQHSTLDGADKIQSIRLVKHLEKRF